jgi:hypothetical protein
MPTPPDPPAYATIREAIDLREQGRSPEAKPLLKSLIAEVEAGDDAYAKVFLAHSLADAQKHPEDELVWDLRALAFLDDMTDQHAVNRGNSGAKNARRHFDLGRTYLDALSNAEHDDGIRNAFAEGI